jgi:hypothetical protein
MTKLGTKIKNLIDGTEQTGTPNDLIDLFRTIPAGEYEGESSTSCLVGYPLHHGVLEVEFKAYLAANKLSEYDITGDAEIEWLSKRYGVDIVRLNEVYFAVAEYESVAHNVTSAIQFAERHLVKDTTQDVEDTLSYLGLFDDGDDEDGDWDESRENEYGDD